MALNICVCATPLDAAHPSRIVAGDDGRSMLYNIIGYVSDVPMKLNTATVTR